MGRLLQTHLNDPRGSGLSDGRIGGRGFYSGTAERVREDQSRQANPGLVLPHRPCDSSFQFARVRPDGLVEPDGERLNLDRLIRRTPDNTLLTCYAVEGSGPKG